MASTTLELAPTPKATSSVAEAAQEEPTLPPSIKDLVKNSLAKIKESYQVFIEMSNIVRDLLK